MPPSVPSEAAPRDVMLFAGVSVREFTPEITVRDLPGDLAEVRLLSHNRDSLKVWHATDIPGDGRLPDVPVVAGNSVRLAISVQAGQSWPTVTIEGLQVLETLTGPEEGALRLGPGDTVDTTFDTDLRAAFVRVEPTGSGPLDVVAFGAADVLIANPAAGGFDLDRSTAWDRVDLPHAGSLSFPSGFLRIAANDVAGAQVFRMTWIPPNATSVTSTSPQGHARLSVRAVSERVLAFPSARPDAFARHWFGVDRDNTQDNTSCDALAVSCQVGARLNCTNHAGDNGRVRRFGVWVPAVPPVCYDFHQGTDFALRGLVAGQASGVDVTAAADGIVLFTADGNTDDCFFDPFSPTGNSCANVQYRRPFWEELTPRGETPANQVLVRQDDGLLAWYYHLRQGSVRVFPGQAVRCGQKLGQVGSSGDSVAPHLHFELRSPRSALFTAVNDLEVVSRNSTDTVDPFPDRWSSWSSGDLPSTNCP